MYILISPCLYDACTKHVMSLYMNFSFTTMNTFGRTTSGSTQPLSYLIAYTKRIIKRFSKIIRKIVKNELFYDFLLML